MKTTTSTLSAAGRRRRSRNVLLGPPGLFIGLTLAALVAGICIARSSDAEATSSHPQPAATARR
jgi:hypothetical protein